MLLYKDYNNETGITITKLIEYDYKQLEETKIKFKEFQEKNIISGNFEDTKWILSNKISKVTINFDFDEVLYTNESKKRNMYTFKQFINSIKSYVVLNIDKKSIDILQFYTGILKKYLHSTNFLNEDYAKKGFESLPKNIINGIPLFIKMYIEYIEFEGTEYYRSVLEELIEYVSIIRKSEKSKEDKRRSLADFQSLLLFDELIEKFWTIENSKSSSIFKEHFFPLYLWWRITNIIPLRLNEFAVTPYDCIEETDDGKFYINLRRSTLKGQSRNKTVHHDLEHDFKIYRYIVSKEIADLIKEYKQITNKNRKDFDRLLCYVTFTLNANNNPKNPDLNKEMYNSNFSSSTITTLISRFFVNIVQDKFNYEILTSDDFINERITCVEEDTVTIEFKPLKDNQISIIKPGDIRHYAMINLVLNDVNPILVKEIVSHEDVNTSFHYFGNTSELVKCMSYNKYREICKKEYDKEEKNKSIITTDKIFNQLEHNKSVQVDNGRCISKYFIAGQLNDCVSVDGDCENCDFFIQETGIDKETQKGKLKIIEEKIERQSELISNILCSYKDTPKVNKDLTQNTLILQNQIQLYYDESLKNGGIAWE